MKAIFKYELEPDEDGFCEVSLPREARLLSVGEQQNHLMIWAMVTKFNPHCIRALKIVGTGHECGMVEDSPFIGTVKIGPFVWHIFDLGER